MEQDSASMNRRLTELASHAQPFRGSEEVLVRVRRRRHLRSGLAAGTCAVVTAAALGGTAVLQRPSPDHRPSVASAAAPRSCGTPRPPTLVPVPAGTYGDSAYWKDQSDVDTAADKVRELSGTGSPDAPKAPRTGGFAGSYTGVYVDAESRTLVVYRRPDPAFDAAVCRNVHGVRVEFRDALRSLIQQDELQGRLWRVLAGNGVKVYSSSPDLDGTITFGVDDPAPAKRILAAYGRTVSVVKSAPVLGTGGLSRKVPPTLGK